MNIIRHVSHRHGKGSVSIRCLDVTPDEESYGMVTDAIQNSIKAKVEKLQQLFDDEMYCKSDDEKLSDRKLNTKSKEVAAITKQLQELDSRLSLGSLATDLHTALDKARQDCAVLHSQARSRMATANNKMAKRRLSVAKHFANNTNPEQ